jgi:putative NADPH-quinone reductase
MSNKEEAKALRGRTATLIVTSQAPALFTALPGVSVVPMVRWNVLGLCGIKTTETYIYGSMDSARDTEVKREQFLARIRRAAAGLQLTRQVERAKASPISVPK